MIIRVDAANPTPPYEQLRRQIATAIATGELAPGTRLPTVRQLAGDLGVANGTVMRAYAELETAGAVTTARGGGTRVADNPERSRDNADELTILAHTYVSQASAAGASPDQILTAVRKVLQAQ